MSAKRALIVDDSRSARAFLSRILERYQLQVDNAASAEEALDYLTRSRPDVIFMDHLMPGMDGFQALTAIKNDPRTATIPIMMYTSQEGELYLSQARALGALGVLPKQTKPADVSRALEQLHLLGEPLPVPVGDTAEHSVLTAEVPALVARAQAAASYAAPTISAAAAGAAVDQRRWRRRCRPERRGARPDRSDVAGTRARDAPRDEPQPRETQRARGGGTARAAGSARAGDGNRRSGGRE